jgi:hypothetical protein
VQLVEVHVGYARSRSTRGHGGSRVAAALGAALIVALAVAYQPATAQPSRGPRMLHLPMRWCVLEGSPAARRPTAAVLERIRRGSSILAREAGITLQSAITSALGKEVGFPVIADPRPRVGRLGDVVVPVESSVEYRLVSERCEQAWRRIEQAAGPGAGLGAIARGPTSVIIRDFVTRSGAPYPAVWGYGFSVSSAGDYCAAANPIVRSATGGTLMVVDSSDGQPSALLDRRLIAHEVGHILRLGHGNGFDDRGSVAGRIDKFCDDTENPDVVPGSLMSASLRYERVTPWQRILPRTVAARHPAVVADQPIIRVLPPRIRSELLQRLGNGGSRVVDRLLPPGNRNLTPLERLRSAGVLGASTWDVLGDARGRDATNPSDLQGLGLSVDGESGDTTVWWEPVGDPAGPGVDQVFDGVVDSDDDPSTGGTGDPTDPSDPGGGPFIDWGAILGAELYFQVSTSAGESDVKAWTWDDLVSDWQVVDPPPSVTFGDFFGEESPVRRSKTVELTLPASTFSVSERFSMGGRLRTIARNGREVVDSLPDDVDDGVRESMTLATPEYPVCAVNRGAELPGTAQPGGPASLEVFGFGDGGRVSLWLDDAQEPLARRDYWEVPDDTWPWVTEVDLPDDTAPGMHMMQVAFDGSGMTANCPLVVGDTELPDFDAPAE